MGSDGARIDAGAEERTDRHVSHQLLGDNCGELFTQFADLAIRCHSAHAEIAYGPISGHRGTITRDPHVFPGPQLAHVFEEGTLEQRRMEMQVLIDRLWIGLAGNVRTGKQSLYLAREQDPPAIIMKIQLLDP